MSVNRASTDYIVIHCADTFAKMDIGRAEIDRWHRDKGWNAIGYHKVIRRNGVIEDGRPLDTIGAHVEGFNAKSVGICMVGGRGEDGPEDNFTARQWESLRNLVIGLKEKYPRAKIVGHRDLNSGKACPSFDVSAWREREGV